jgi:outer membrane protein OmpA-like peptidoglycan-associated protein
MAARRLCVALSLLAILAAATGCLVPAGKANSLAAQNRSLAERNDALTAQLDNLKVHSENIENLLLRAEEDLAMMEGQAGIHQERLEAYRSQRTRRTASVDPLPGVPPQTEARLARISKRYGNLAFAPGDGVSKLDTDILFDEGDDALKPGAAEVLRGLATTLNSEDGQELKVLLVGHTDSQAVARKPARDRFQDNFDLSTSRARRVGDTLQKMGVAPERIGIAGYGDNQPVAPNTSDENRRKNRRVEIFVMAQEVPVVGWTESTPSLY